MGFSSYTSSLVLTSIAGRIPFIVLAATVLSGVSGNLFHRLHNNARVANCVLAGMLAGLARRVPLVVAVFFMAVSFFAFMKLLTVADLSFAVPVTAASVALETVLARVILKEKVTALRWAGALSVACGVALLAM